MSDWIVVRSIPSDDLSPSIHCASMDQNLIVSPPNMISPVGDLIRYFPKAVGPSLDDTFTPSLVSRTRKVKDCA
jgi:hypothetical protein